MSAVLDLTSEEVTQAVGRAQAQPVINPQQDLFKPWAIAAMAAIVCSELES